LENPANGSLKKFIGKPVFVYQPWQFGSPWTKKTALWGNFNIPKKKFENWNDIKKNHKLYIRPNREKPSLALFHKSVVNDIEEFKKFKDFIKTDADVRSLCCEGFAKSFYEINK
jgi:hypothetical protein